MLLKAKKIYKTRKRIKQVLVFKFQINNERKNTLEQKWTSFQHPRFISLELP